MKNNYDRIIYIKNLQENTGRILMDKLFDKYFSYINYTVLNSTLNSSTENIYFNDPVSAFFDTLCRKITQKHITDKNTVIYHIMSPCHKKEVISGLLVIYNNSTVKKAMNLQQCKPQKLYTIDFTDKDIKYLHLSHSIFKNGNKIQQE